MNDCLVVNLYGGPGCGKSTVAARVYYELKMKGVNVELVTEYVKDIVYGKSECELADQMNITSQQNHRLLRLTDKVDVIICDASLLNAVVYEEANGKTPLSAVATNAAIQLYKLYNNIGFYIPRTGIYSRSGRYHTEEQSKKIDQIFKNTIHFLPESESVILDINDVFHDEIVYQVMNELS